MDLTLDGNHASGAGNPVDEKVVTFDQRFLGGENFTHAQQSGNQLGHGRFVDVVFHASGQQLTEFFGVNGSEHGDGHAFGAGLVDDLVQRRSRLAQVESCDVDLENRFVPRPGAVELKRAATQLGLVFQLDAMNVNGGGWAVE